MENSTSNSAIVALFAIIVIAVGLFLFMYLPQMMDQTDNPDAVNGTIDVNLPDGSDDGSSN